MSGRQHHYLPQLIQRPFACRQKGKQYYVHAHHRARGRFAPNTGGLGKELDFYGGPDDSSLDDAITNSEGALAEIVQAINRGDDVAKIEMATLICALAFRTKATREALSDMLPALTSALREHFQSGARLRRDLLSSLTDRKSRRALIEANVRKEAGHLAPEQQKKAALLMRIQWQSFVAARGSEIVASVEHFAYSQLSKARSEARTTGDQAFRRALANDPTMTSRALRFEREFAFGVINATPGEFFVLGDCGPIAIYTDGRPRLVLGAPTNEVDIDTLFLPVSPSRCVVGRLLSSNTELSVKEINRASASLSLEFFISDRDTGGDLDELRASIGSLVPIDTESDIVEALLEQMD